MQKRRIFIGDDEPSVLLYAKVILTKMGHDVLEFSDSKLLIGKAKEKVPDLVLLDDIMPRYTGIQVLESLRFIPSLKSVPIIMMTPQNRVEWWNRARDFGATDRLIKPFTSSSLIDVIKRYLP